MDLNKFKKGSSKPKGDKTLSSKISDNISVSNVFKVDSRIVSIMAINDVQVYKLVEGDYMDAKRIRWNFEFEGNAQITIACGEGRLTDPKNIQGYARVKDDNVEQISEIQIL